MLTSEPTVIAHPSTKTNNSNLNGKAINIGDSIIIPKDIRIDEITISITKKGKKIRIKGYLEEFSLSREEADELIMSARNIVYK